MLAACVNRRPGAAVWVAARWPPPGVFVGFFRAALSGFSCTQTVGPLWTFVRRSTIVVFS